jgi:hypothetical protein
MAATSREGGRHDARVHAWANTLQLRAQLVGMGLLTEPEVRDFLRLLDDPEFIGSLPILIAGYGRRPAEPASRESAMLRRQEA